jgi:DNA repair exonuclease SbcCD nuclease subunit
MRIVHLADTHLGFRQFHRTNDAGRNQREQDIYNAFEHAIAKIVELRPDAVVHAGDLFDSYHPTSAALSVALDGLRHLREADIPVVVIAGNHSTPRATATEHVFGVLERFGGVYMVYNGARGVRIGDLEVHAIAHDNDPESVANALRAARPDSSAKFNVLVAHIGVEGLGQVVGSEAGAVTLPGDALADAGEFDYIALGHLHELAPVRDNAAYAGSLERLSWADKARVKGIIEVDLAAGRSSADYLTVHPIDGRPFIELEAVDAATARTGLSDEIIARAEGLELDGAMVRLAVHNVSSADWHLIDHKAIAEVYGRCLHFEREPHYLDDRMSVVDATPQLRDFLHSWAASHAQGTDVEDLLTRAEAFLALADQELAK